MAMLPPRASEFRSILSVKRRGFGAADELGNRSRAFGTVASGVRAKVEDTRGGEQIRQERIASIANFDITLRSSEVSRSITTADVLVDETVTPARIFNIKWIGDLTGTGRFVSLACQTGGALD